MKKQSLFNVALYIRLSKEDGDKLESFSISNQRQLLLNFLGDKEEFVLQDIYIDDGYTGLNFNRPSFSRMIDAIETGKVNCVIVKDLSRLGRDYIETGKYIERYFPDYDVRFISLTDNIDSMKHTYDMLLPIKNIFNEQYSRDISKKVHASMTTKQKSGEFIGAFTSYGYKKSPTNKNKLIIDEPAAEIVRRIFNMYSNGYGKVAIANALNRDGIVCPSEYKRLNGENYRNYRRLETTSYWTYSTINRMLQNEMYIGSMVQGKTIQHMRRKAKATDKDNWIIVPNTHDAIIDYTTWSKVHDLLNRRTRTLELNSNQSIFAGYLKCGDCKRALVKKISTSKKNGKTITYCCGTYTRSGSQFCTKHPIPHLVLEKIVLDDLKAIVQSLDNLQELIERQEIINIPTRKTTEHEINRLNAELNKIRKRKKAVYEDYQEELISKEEYISYRQDYLANEELLEKQLESLMEHQDEDIPQTVFENPWIKKLQKFRSINELDRDIVTEMIHEIRVYEDSKIKIIYNFSNELEHLFQTTYTSDNIG